MLRNIPSSCLAVVEPYQTKDLPRALQSTLVKLICIP
jgi:hypothetical protein